MLGEGLGERSGLEVRGFTGEVPQEVHLLDATINEHAATVQGAAAAPVAGVEWGLLVQLPAFCAMKEDSHWGEKCSKVHSCKGYIPSQRANERKCPLGDRSAPCTSIRR